MSGEAPEKGRLPAGIAVFLVSAALFFPMLGRRELSSRAEARIPLVGLDIVRTGRVLPPYLLGEPYLNKPPLHHLLAAGAIKVFGRHDEWVVRLPSILCGALAVSLTWLLGARLAGTRSGLIAAAFLFLSYRFFSLARSTELEILLTAATCLVYLGLAGVLWNRPGPGSARGWWVAALGVATASLTKGPLVALIFPFVLLAADAAIRRSPSHLRSRGSLILVLGAVAGASIYYVPLMIELGGVSALLDRLTFENVAHRHGFHYYFWQLPLGLLPAGLLLPTMFLGLRRPDTVAKTCALAVTIGVVVFSLSSSKQSHYLLPLYPLVASWAGRSTSPQSWSESRWRIGVVAAAVLACGLLCLDLTTTIHSTPKPSDVMKDFAWMTRGKPVAMVERHPLLAYYLDRPDLEFAGSADAAARFVEDRWGFLILDLEAGETLPPELRRLAVLHHATAKGHDYVLLTHRLHQRTNVESAPRPEPLESR